MVQKQKNNDKKQIEALIYMLSKGMNYIEGNLFYIKLANYKGLFATS